MTNVLVRDLPDDVHAALQRKASLRNQSLQQFLSVELRLLAERTELSEILDRIDTYETSGEVGFAAAVDAIAAERDLR